MAIYTPPSYTGRLVPTGLPAYGFPDDQNEQSYFDIALNSPTARPLTPVANTNTYYDAWCLDVTAKIGVGTTTLSLYSSYELGVLQSSAAFSSSQLLPNYVSKLDNINWLLNYYTGQSPYTKGDVQVAIWNLLGQSGVDNSPSALQNIYGYNQARADQLVSLANTVGEGYVPMLGQAIGIVVATTQSGAATQPIIIEAKAAALGDFVWEDKNANGIQDSGETGIAGVTVQLVRDMDGNGTFSANEILGTTTTDSAGKYSFGGLTPGLDYQVLFTTPSGGYVASTRQADGSAASGVNSDGPLTNVVQLASGENNITLDAGFYKLAQLGDRVWFDANGNGVQDAGELNATGVTVNLLNAAGTVIATQVTSGSGTGNYLFTNLVPGTYSVQFVAPTGYTFTTKDASGNTVDASDSDADTTTGRTGTYTLSSGQTELTVDAGLVPIPVKAHLGDFVWLDANANGVQDAGEAGIAGVTVNLKNSAGTVIAATTTNSSGLYGFDVDPGTYSVQFVKPSGYVLTAKDVGGNTAAADAVDSDADATTGLTGSYTLAAGDNNLTIDAGLYQLASLGDRVWYDANANGIQDASEANATGVTVNLLNAAGSVIATQVTSGSGSSNYLFTNLVPGTYSVQFVAPTGYTFTTKDAAGNTLDASDSDADTITGKTGTYTLTSGQSNITVDAGLIPIPKAHLGDRVWLDSNANGVQDAGEVGLANVIVNLKDSVGAVIASTLTDSNGIYGFDVNPGTYSVQFAKPSGYVLTAKDIGGNTTAADAVDSDADTSTGMTGNYTLAAGDNNLTIDAGLYRLASLGDFVWEDKNGSGTQDGGEPGIPNVLVQLYTCVHDAAGNQVPGTLVATQTTDAAGGYNFTGLIPGEYIVKFTTPSGYVQTTANVGPNDATDSDAGAGGLTGCYTLTSGQNETTVDAGFVKSPALSLQKTVLVVDDCPAGPIGSAVVDTDKNGIPDSGINLGNLTKYLMFFANGSQDANWQGATKGFAGDVVVDGIQANERTSGAVPFAGTLYTNDSTAGAWQGIVTQNGSQATLVTGATSLVSGLESDLTNAFKQIDGLTATAGFTSVAAASLNGLNTQDGISKTYIINVTSGFQVSSQIKITGDAGDLYVLRWDTDANAANGYQGQVKFQSGGAIVPYGGLSSANFINVAGDIGSSGGGTTPANLPQGPRLDDGTGALIAGGKDFSGGGFFTGYWLTTGDPTNGDTSSLSNAIFTGGWYTLSDKFSLTSGTSGVHVCLDADQLTFDPTNVGAHVQSAMVGQDLIYTYKVTNNSSGALANPTVKDDAGTAGSTADDFSPTAVLATNGQNFGDTNANGVFDAGESWYFRQVVPAAAAGSLTNIATATSGTASATDSATVDIRVTPLVIDLNGDGIHTVSSANSTGNFDLLGNGHAVGSGWIASGDAFLATDKNGNGKIDGIGELFGGMAAGAGFVALTAYDSNHDGVIDGRDADFRKLLVWQDLNGDHQSSANELMTLAQAGIASLSLAYASRSDVDAQGNLLGETSSATLSSGINVAMTDVYFNVASRTDALLIGPQLPQLADLLDSGTLATFIGPVAPSAAQEAMPDVHTEQISNTDTGAALRHLAKLYVDDVHHPY